MDESKTPRTCAHCGASNIGEDLYCASCGEPFIPQTDVPEGSPREPAADSGQPGQLGQRPDREQPAPPPPVGPTNESRNWGLAAHLSALAGAVMGGLPAFLGPLIIWLLRRDEDDVFATEHARSALNFNLSVLLYVIAGVVLTIVTLGLALLVLIPVLLVAFAGYFVVTVMAAVAASQGRPFRYPLAIPFVG